tara:strand:- start:211 stop:750 length:540 start_codon:yes stop_codon:yes gene_type:complete
MSRLVFFILFLSVLFIQVPIFGNQFFEKKEEMMSLSIDMKSFVYDETTNEEVVLIGGRSRKYFEDSDWYWGEAGYAAIKGKRHGYIEGAICLGYRPSMTDHLILDLSFSLGAAGGGGNPNEGGGLNLQAYYGFGYRILPDYILSYFYGQTWFLNGALESPIWGFRITHDFKVLRGPYVK